MSRHSAPPIPHHYRPLTRPGTHCRPGDLIWHNWHRPTDTWETACGFRVPAHDSGDVYIRPIDRRTLRRYPACAHCHRTHYNQGMGYPGESARAPVKLREVSPGRLVCSRCVSQAKGSVTRHFNLVRRLGGMPTYEGQHVSAPEAQRRHIHATLS